MFNLHEKSSAVRGKKKLKRYLQRGAAGRCARATGWHWTFKGSGGIAFETKKREGKIITEYAKAQRRRSVRLRHAGCAAWGEFNKLCPDDVLMSVLCQPCDLHARRLQTVLPRPAYCSFRSRCWRAPSAPQPREARAAAAAGQAAGQAAAGGSGRQLFQLLLDETRGESNSGLRQIF